MIRSCKIRNFRCFEDVRLDAIRQVTLITGDNGSGKTALLEAIFLALSSGSGVAMRLRQQRGFDGFLAASVRRLEETFWGGFFYKHDTQRSVSISLEGDADATRELSISRARSAVTMSLHDPDKAYNAMSAPISFTWRNSYGEVNTVIPTFTEGNVVLPDTGEDLPDFFFVPAFATIGSAESAGRFSELSQRNAHRSFIEVFTREFNWISDLAIEVSAGTPVIFATIRDSGRKIPLPEVSSGLNRMVAILLAISGREKSIVLIDEIENGIYFQHYGAFWSAVVELCRLNQSQVFVSTHSAECLSAFRQAVPSGEDSVELWQVDREGGAPFVNRVSGRKLMKALEYNQDVR